MSNNRDALKRLEAQVQRKINNIQAQTQREIDNIQAQTQREIAALEAGLQATLRCLESLPPGPDAELARTFIENLAGEPCHTAPANAARNGSVQPVETVVLPASADGLSMRKQIMDLMEKDHQWWKIRQLMDQTGYKIKQVRGVLNDKSLENRLEKRNVAGNKKGLKEFRLKPKEPAAAQKPKEPAAGH